MQKLNMLFRSAVFFFIFGCSILIFHLIMFLFNAKDAAIIISTCFTLYCTNLIAMTYIIGNVKKYVSLQTIRPNNH